MATVNIQRLIQEINTKLLTVTDPLEILRLSKAVDQLKIGKVFTVWSFSSLPNAQDNVGKLFLVESENTLYFAYPYFQDPEKISWVSIINVKLNTTMLSWGNGSAFRLGVGYRGSPTIASQDSPMVMAGGNSTGVAWCDVSIGNAHGLALKTDGTLWTWGTQSQGGLGDGTTTARNSPGTVAGGGTTWCAIQAMAYASLAIKIDGTLWSWGCNASGQLGDGTTVSRCSPGTTWGSYTTWCKAGGMRNTAIALKKDGTVWTWGPAASGQLGDGTTTIRCSPGSIWGSYTSWCEISSGSSTLAAIKTDGTLWTWGSNISASLANGSFSGNRCSPGTVIGGGNNWCGVCMGFDVYGGIKSDGTIWMWGCGSPGQKGDGNLSGTVSPGTVIGGGNNWCKLSVWFRNSMAIKTDGTLWAWGCNRYGQLGIGDNSTAKSSPTKVYSGECNENEYKWFTVAAGPFTAVGIRNNTQ